MIIHVCVSMTMRKKKEAENVREKGTRTTIRMEEPRGGTAA